MLAISGNIPYQYYRIRIHLAALGSPTYDSTTRPQGIETRNCLGRGWCKVAPSRCGGGHRHRAIAWPLRT